MKDEHAKETSAIREQFSKTLQNDRAALKAKLDKAEAEIARLKSSSLPKPKENPDLTTLLGLKAFGKSLAEKEEAQATAKVSANSIFFRFVSFLPRSEPKSHPQLRPIKRVLPEHSAPPPSSPNHPANLRTRSCLMTFGPFSINAVKNQLKFNNK